MVLYAQELSILSDPVGKRNHRNIVGSNVTVHRFLGQTCSQDVALSFDTKFFVIKSLVFMQGVMTLNWFLLPTPPLMNIHSKIYVSAIYIFLQTFVLCVYGLWPHEVSMPRIGCYNDSITPKFDRRISQRLKKSKPESHAFETSGDLAVRRPSA